MPLVTSGVEYGNLRELCLKRMEELGTKCRDVRTREVGIVNLHQTVLSSRLFYSLIPNRFNKLVIPSFSLPTPRLLSSCLPFSPFSFPRPIRFKESHLLNKGDSRSSRVSTSRLHSERGVGDVPCLRGSQERHSYRPPPLTKVFRDHFQAPISLTPRVDLKNG